MRLRDKIICFVCIVLAVGLFIGAGVQLDSINLQRQDMNLIIDTPENIPPSLAFATIATGAFRGLIVDILWMRADKLKEEGQFFDARQLAEWITILQPRFASVWEFHAWNMAYNISVAIPETQPDQRWQWVRNGYELIRDQAIDKYKLKNITLFRELGRIFQHKIGGVSDDAHKYYKLQLALSMEPLLGPADNQYFDALAEAPVSWQEISNDPNIASLIKALKSADDAFSEDNEFVSNYLSLRQNSKRFVPAAGQVIDNFRGTVALEKFDIFAKAWQLRKVWKLDPVLMREVNRYCGPIDWNDPNTHLPLDWRHPDSHAIYWAIKGLKILAEDEGREIDATETNADRIVFHSLQDLFRNGKIFIYELQLPPASPDSPEQPKERILKEVFLRPDLRMFDPYNNSVLTTLEKYKEAGDEQRTVSLQNGHRNMLKNAVNSFYYAGHKRQAQKIYTQLRKLYPLEEFKNPIVDEYVKERFKEELDAIGINDAKEMITMMLRDSYYLYAIRDDDGSFNSEKMAEQVWNYYQVKHDDPEFRINLPSLQQFRSFALRDFLNDQLFPPYLRQTLLGRIRIEKPELYKQLEAEAEKLRKQSEQAK
ncbi:MAG: hypothetical protein RQ760_02170 [Sedimentisphaerales bacterium]|nr:hypothetical protein [Sedimentisphaerales bacterium]